MRPVEQASFLLRDASQVYVVRYEPDQAAQCCCVFLNPLDNEAANSIRLYVRVARELARSGCLCLRFDYSGTGNSSGTFSEITLASLVEDVKAVSAMALSLQPALPLWLIGGRFGATLACLAADSQMQLEGLVLWDPIFDMAREFRVQYLNKTLLNNKLMGGNGKNRRSFDDIAQAAGFLELNCLMFNRTFYHEMASLIVHLPHRFDMKHLRVLLSRQASVNLENELMTDRAGKQGVEVGRLGRTKATPAWGVEGFSESEASRLLTQATLEFIQSRTLSAAR